MELEHGRTHRHELGSDTNFAIILSRLVLPHDQSMMAFQLIGTHSFDSDLPMNLIALKKGMLVVSCFNQQYGVTVKRFKTKSFSDETKKDGKYQPVSQRISIANILNLKYQHQYYKLERE